LEVSKTSIIQITGKYNTIQTEETDKVHVWITSFRKGNTWRKLINCAYLVNNKANVSVDLNKALENELI